MLVEARLDALDEGVASSRLSSAGKWVMTSGSAFIAAKGPRSCGSQRRRTRRAVRIAGTLTHPA